MPKPGFIELPTGDRISILYEDRSVLAIDKPPGWMLIPFSWQRTAYNLQAALVSSIAAGDFWARSRNLKFLKYTHRLDAETSGILLLAKSPGAVETFGRLFETRQMEKVYLAVVEGSPKEKNWFCQARLGPDPHQHGRMKIDRGGKSAETQFNLVLTAGNRSLIEARPLTGRTHQIRLHLRESGSRIIGDELYGVAGGSMGLRAVGLSFRNPFTGKKVQIKAEVKDFLSQFGFDPRAYEVRFGEK